MANNNYLFSLDEDTVKIIKAQPNGKRSAFVRDVLKKSAAVDTTEPKQLEKPKVKRVHIVRLDA